MKTYGAGQEAQKVKVLAAKPDDLTFIPGTDSCRLFSILHTVECVHTHTPQQRQQA